MKDLRVEKRKETENYSQKIRRDRFLIDQSKTNQTFKKLELNGNVRKNQKERVRRNYVNRVSEIT